MKLHIPHISFKRRPKFSRASARHACQIDAQLMLMDRMFSYDGRVIDMSTGGAMFRPKLAYLMYRRDVPVCLSVGDDEIFAHIVGTAPAGFSLRFDEPIEEADILRIIAACDPTAKAAA